MATRRTHIVRCAKGDPPSEDEYFDVEVLEAIAFRTTNNKEMVLSLPTEKAVPYIVDDTGGGHEKKPDHATRRSHMKRITNPDNPTQMFDAEILDCVAFTGENGEQWILDLPAVKANPFNVTEGSGDSKSTRRTHEEKVYTDRKNKKGDDFVTVERCDTMAFRTINGQEMIIKMESHDDSDDGSGRADTFIVSPEGYDPDNEDGPKPPANKDAHNYIKFVEGANDFITGKAKIDQGPLWWIRKVKSAGGWAIITAVSYGGAPGVVVRNEDEKAPDPTILYDKTITIPIPGPEPKTFVYDSPRQQALGWRNGPETPFFLYNGTPIHIWIPSDYYHFPNVGYDSLADFLAALKRFNTVPNAPYVQGFQALGMPPDHPPNFNGIVQYPFPGAGGRDTWSYPGEANYGSIYLTPVEEAKLWVQFSANQKALHDAWATAFVAAEIARGPTQAPMTEFQDILAPGYNFVSSGSPASYALTAWGQQQFGDETMHFRQVIVKLAGATTKLIVDLSLPLPAPIDLGDGSFTKGTNSSVVVAVISEWPTPPSTEKLVLPITSNAKGVLNEPSYDTDDIAGNGGNDSDGWTGGSYTLTITTSEDDPIAPKTKKKKLLAVTPALPGMWGGTGSGEG